MKKKMFKALPYIVYFTIAIFCFFMFYFDWDVRQTAASAFGLLEGHILDFYDYCWNIEGLAHGTIYEIVIYIIFALWNIPLYIFGVRPNGAELGVFASLWNKLLLVIVFFACGFLLKAIAKKMELSEKRNKSVICVWCAMPLLFFLVMIQGSYDILYIVFMLAGIYFWLDTESMKSVILFNVFFGIAICIKPFPIFYYLIILLIKEKNVFRIIGNGMLMALPYGLCKIIYIHSPGYKAVLAFNGGNLSSVYANAFTYLVPFIVIYLFICAKAYWYDVEKQDNIDVLFLCNLASFSFIGFSNYHPQWIMGAIPFWVLSFFYNKRKEGYALVVFVLTVAFYMLFGLEPEVHVNQDMLYLLSNKWLGVASEPVFSINKFYLVNDIRIPYSIVSACVFILAYFSQRNFCLSEQLLARTSIIERKLKGLLVTIFIAGVLAFIIPALLCWFPPKFMERRVAGENIESNIPDTTTVWIDEMGYKEYFWCDKDCKISTLGLYVYTWDKKYSEDDVIYLKLMDSSDKEIYTYELNLDTITNNLVYIPVKGELKEGEWYSITFSGVSNEEEDLAAIGVYNVYDTSRLSLKRGDVDCNQTIAFNIVGTLK